MKLLSLKRQKLIMMSTKPVQITFKLAKFRRNRRKAMKKMLIK